MKHAPYLDIATHPTRNAATRYHYHRTVAKKSEKEREAAGSQDWMRKSP